MVFRIDECVDVLKDKCCNIGDLVLISREGLKILVFMGANYKDNNTWKVDFLLSKRYEDKTEDAKCYIVNSDLYTSYNGKISLEIGFGEEIQFDQSLGYYVMEEYQKGMLKKK